VVRSVFKTVEAFARGLVGSIPTLSRQGAIPPEFMRVSAVQARECSVFREARPEHTGQLAHARSK